MFQIDSLAADAISKTSAQLNAYKNGRLNIGLRKTDWPITLREPMMNALDAAQLIEQLGGRILIGYGGLTEEVSASEFDSFARDSDVFFSKRFHITKERFIAWRTFNDSTGVCTGITRAGNPCKSTHIERVSPDKFVPGESDRCSHHIDIAK